MRLPTIPIKADLHIHTKDDKYDTHITQSANDIIRKSIRIRPRFNCLAFTNHDTIALNDEIVKCAEENDVIILPGLEKFIEGRHVLLYVDSNLKNNETLLQIKTFKDLSRFKKEGLVDLVIAAHPFYLFQENIHSKVIKHIDLFDAIEYSWFYSKKFLKLFNKKALIISKYYNKPLISTSDSHFFSRFGKNFSIIHTFDKSAKGIIEAIKEGRVDPPLFNPASNKEIILSFFIFPLIKLRNMLLK